MKNFKIEKGGTPPDFPKRGLVKYPFSEMDVNDFFFISKEKAPKNLAKYLYEVSDRRNKTFKLEPWVNEDGIPGFRVWRIR